MNLSIVFRSEVFREGDLYVALCPDLDVSSYGESIAETRQSLREAVEAFIEACHEMGTLEQVLEEAGCVKGKDNWLLRQPVTAELVSIG